MTKTIYTSRTPVQAYQRCKRLRWLSTAEGPEGMGLEPARKSSHLVVGGAVHAGMEQLLKRGQQALDEEPSERSLSEKLDSIFERPNVHDLDKLDYKKPVTLARHIENCAVAAALAEFSASWSDGVELDPEEARQRAAAGQAEVVGDFADLVANPIGRAAGSGGAAADSPIVVDFSDFGMTTVASAQAAPMEITAAPAYQPFDQDAWLKEEMAALVEGMVRCWARRRWRGLLEQFEVLEVEREGEWKLAEWDSKNNPDCVHCGYSISSHAFAPGDDKFSDKVCDHFESVTAHKLHFLSRHDALLLERSTGYLYLQSFKTTGSWDRRKELDAQVDMQGLSEAVDVERRFGEWWDLTHHDWKHKVSSAEYAKDFGTTPRIIEWLRELLDPPTILGVRYEYLLKGSRKENKKAQPGEPRWNQESVLVRAWKQEGITAEDRRWAWSYDWVDEAGKSRRLDYRSWQKAAVWKAMPVADWIDLLDAGKVQEGAMGEDGEELDALAAQLVPVLVAYRSSDEMLDLLEQLEAQEVQVAKDVEAVREAERTGGYSAKRTELNRRFGQNRQACSYPGLCPYRTTATQPGFCFGPPDAEHDPSVLEHYRTRRVNHPAEAGLVQIAGVENV